MNNVKTVLGLSIKFHLVEFIQNLSWKYADFKHIAEVTTQRTNDGSRVTIIKFLFVSVRIITPSKPIEPAKPTKTKATKGTKTKATKGTKTKGTKKSKGLKIVLANGKVGYSATGPQQVPTIVKKMPNMNRVNEVRARA